MPDLPRHTAETPVRPRSEPLDRVLKLSPLVGSLPIQSIRRGDGRLDAERLDPFEDPTGDGTVDPHAAKADATQFGSFAERATACVTLSWSPKVGQVAKRASHP